MDLARKTGKTYIEEAIAHYQDQKVNKEPEDVTSPSQKNKFFDSEEFYSAIQQGDTETVKRLLDEGQNPDPATSKYTPIMFAASEGHTEILRAILEHHPRLNRINKNGYTALHIAAISGDTDCVKLLLDYGIDLNIKTKEDDTALHKAIMLNNPEMVRLLLQKGADPNVDNARKYRPIDLAILKSNYEIIEELLKNGAQPSEGDTFEDLKSRASNSKVAGLIEPYC